MAGTVLCAVGLMAAVLLTAFVAWDVWPLRSLDPQDLRAVLALGTCVGVWFTLSKEGRSEWWR